MLNCRIRERVLDDGTFVEVLTAEHSKLVDMVTPTPLSRKRKGTFVALKSPFKSICNCIYYLPGTIVILIGY